MLPNKPACIEERVVLAPFTYFRIGGPARYFARITNEQELIDAIAFAQEQRIRITVLSGGSNVLVSDEGFDGLVLHMEMRALRVDGEHIIAQSGVPMASLVQTASLHALAGLEWAIGIPGMVGGSVRGNAGCFGAEVKDTLVHVRAYDIHTRTWMTYTNAECVFAYRESMFKRHPELIIVEATFALTSGDKDAIIARVRDFTRTRIAKQDIGEKCAGCMFKNPEGEYAGRLIEEAGLKGFVIGGAKVSAKHGNFIVNTGDATATDVRAVVTHVQEKIKKDFGITLETEIQNIF